jgi:cation transport regulator ChaB
MRPQLCREHRTAQPEEQQHYSAAFGAGRDHEDAADREDNANGEQDAGDPARQTDQHDRSSCMTCGAVSLRAEANPANHAVV